MKFNSDKFSKAILTKRVVEERKTMKQAAAEIGISTAAVCRAENGEMPNALTLFLCCKWLNTKMESYFNL